MTTERRDAVRAGAFALVALAAFVFFLLLLLGRDLLRDVNVYTTVFERTVEGLEEGAPVKYLGVPAGKVTDIRFESGRFPHVQVTMQVPSDVPITSGTRATLDLQILTGVAHVALVGGAEGETRLASGSEIPSQASDYERLSDTLLRIAEGLPKALERLDEAAAAIEGFFGSEMQTRVTGAIERVEGGVEALQRELGSLSEALRGEAGSLARTVEGEVHETGSAARAELSAVRADLADLVQRIEEVVAGEGMRQTVADLRRSSELLASSLERLDRVLSDVEGVVDRGAVDDLRHALREGAELLSELRRRPGLLLAEPARERAIPEPRRSVR